MSKKILAIDQGDHLGGAERFFSEVLVRLPDDFEVHLITTANSSYQNLYQGSSVTLHELDLPQLRPIGLTTLKKFRSTQAELEKKIQELKPDLVLSNTVRTHLLISSLAKRHDIPLVWMAHDLTFPKMLLKLERKYPDLIVACSEFVKENYAAPDKTEVLYPFGIDQAQLDAFASVKKTKTIGMVGKFIPWKNQQAFIRMAAAIHRQHPDYHFSLVASSYAGNGESQAYAAHCQALIEERGLSEVFSWHENMPDLLSEMASWQILIHCSTDPEPLGRVVLEGMATGCAVIASSLGGPQEVIKHQNTGLVVKPSRAPLTAAVDHLITQPELSALLGKNAQAWIGEQFLWDEQIKKLTSFLSKIS